MYRKSNIKLAVSLYVFIFACVFSFSQDKNTRYLKGFCQVFKTKHHYDLFHALDMKYSFVVCDAKGTVTDKLIDDGTTTFTPKKGAGSRRVTGKTYRYDFYFAAIEQDNDKGIFVFDIVIRYKGKFFQAKTKKLVSFDGKKTEIFSFNMNDYIKDPKLLKKLDAYYAKRHKKHLERLEDPLGTPPRKITKANNLSNEASRKVYKKANRAPQLQKDSLEKYWRDEKKGLNIKDSTNIERIKRDLEPILFLSRKPITWEVKPKRKQMQ